MSRRYCTSCQSMKLEEGGVLVKTKVTRWQCAWCHQRKNQSPYANTETRKRYEEERLGAISKDAA